MKTSDLDYQQIFRRGSTSNGWVVAERSSSDFLIDGESLLHALVKIYGGHPDFTGGFVRGFVESNRDALAKFTLQALSDIDSGRVLHLVERVGPFLFKKENYESVLSRVAAF
ncbi:hypothetical protein [Candidatus Cyanaurora vandensis]|uniref:hypothetical protein n=1 Tax=Candidatus Cyanaurora vandensis TaxID=2714958 RepID=UPI00257A8476|nr:hypothetical protein [Candidatus Cyanaurora vandensis]